MADDIGPMRAEARTGVDTNIEWHRKRMAATAKRPSLSGDDRPCVMHPDDDCSLDLPCAECPRG